ncbi:MAG: nucleoside-diphosphate kinase [Candidatus Doudnabacteria bacterium]|nr:nucleoside-diphosphate kinase [Candidatus Doudnabacteria bacterium]
MSERTLAIIKPDVVSKGKIGAVITMIEESGLQIDQMTVTWLYSHIWEKFYAEHVGKSFFDGLIEFMDSGPSVALVLRGENAIQRLRDLNGATNPAKAADGTIRRRFGTPDGGPRNAMHGSDSPESFERELELLFPQMYYGN